jgi:hypothetical protein
MAFECELSFLYRKWMQVDSHLSDGPWITDEQVEEELREMATITKRLKTVCEKMSPLGLDEFVKQSPELSDCIDRFPSLNIGTLAADFQKSLFWSRNRIVHYAFTKYTEDDANKCFSIARLGLDILTHLDAAKRLTLPRS